MVPEFICDQPSCIRSLADLKFTNFRYNLVNVEDRFITETPILCDAIKTGECVDASNHIAVRIVNVCDGQDRHCKEDTKTGKGGPLPDKTWRCQKNYY